MGQRYRRMEDQKHWPVCWHLTRILLKKKGFYQKLKMQCMNWETRRVK